MPRRQNQFSARNWSEFGYIFADVDRQATVRLQGMLGPTGIEIEVLPFDGDNKEKLHKAELSESEAVQILAMYAMPQPDQVFQKQVSGFVASKLDQ